MNDQSIIVKKVPDETPAKWRIFMNDKSEANDHIESEHQNANQYRNEQESKASTDRSRIAILNGWILSMIGIVAYCVAMLDDTKTVNPYASIFERGLWGWAAVIFLIAGVALC